MSSNSRHDRPSREQTNNTRRGDYEQVVDGRRASGVMAATGKLNRTMSMPLAEEVVHSDNFLPYDGTIETTLRFVQARLASPRISHNSLPGASIIPVIKVSDFDNSLDKTQITSPPSSDMTGLDRYMRRESQSGAKQKSKSSSKEWKDSIIREGAERRRAMRRFL